MYRVTLVVAILCWVDLDLDSCTISQLPNICQPNQGARPPRSPCCSTGSKISWQRDQNCQNSSTLSIYLTDFEWRNFDLGSAWVGGWCRGPLGWRMSPKLGPGPGPGSGTAGTGGGSSGVGGGGSGAGAGGGGGGGGSGGPR